jgi:signal transduction histidine kinase
MSGTPRPPRRLARALRRTSVGELLGATIGLLLVLAVVGIGLALHANSQLSDYRHALLDQFGPSVRSTLELENALVNEETGVRGYILTRQPSFLTPYHTGLEAEARAYAKLRSHEAALGPVSDAQIALVRATSAAWRARFVRRALARTRRTARRSIALDVRGKRLFDRSRTALGSLQFALNSHDLTIRSQLSQAADTLEFLLILAGVLILGGVLAAGFLLRELITRPLRRLGAEARRVAGGEFARPLRTAAGPREVAEVGGELESMRERIVAELASVQAAHLQLEEQAGELRRSNAELEQFAYVASHDLQEPLRKVASFCQALQVRYHGQLDERADQYIEFAVDGAKRMQALISDLLAFSRVGRSGREHELIDLAEVLDAARSALADTLQDSGGRVQVGELPTVRGDRAQLTSLFQNLISNALKFHAAEPPVVRIEAQRDGEGCWELTCTDNGIGIEREYAERIFLIFQRLHSREAYAGSGIGLALCRKIVEYHGGSIWLDQEYSAGARFHLTLPIAKETVS